jgi:S-(hydroxymethyl)glutathione dehydrogenase/alcohol dehydrogenase
MMKAAICYEFNKSLVIEDAELAAPIEGEVKVRLAATAICHSDIHDMKGEMPAQLPFIGGHESAGYVEEIGPGVTSVKVGDPVMVSLMYSCGDCYFCNIGLPSQCLNKFSPPKHIRLTNKDGKALAQGGRVGGFAEYVLVDASQLVVVPADMPMDRVALLSCGVITGFGAVVNRAKVRPSESVVIMGVGGVGINAIQGAAYSGAYPIIAVDTLDDKMKIAMDFGATHGVNAAGDNAVDEVKELTSGRGADYVFVTVGSIAAIKQGMAMSSPRGTTVVIGLPPVTEQLCFSPLEIIPLEKNLIGGFMGAVNIKVDIPKLITMYQKGSLKLDEIITGRYPLERINEAIESTEKGEALRNVIMFD